MSKLNLTEQFKDIFDDYTDEIMKVTIDALKEVAEDASDELHGSSGIGGFGGKGKYDKGWTVTEEQHRTFYSATAHNKSRYQLTHLLEFGHAKSNGGRTRAFPHIANVNEKAQDEAVKKIEKAIEAIK